MDVVRHQAIGPDRDPRLAAEGADEVAVEGVVGLAEEGLLAAVAALRDVMGHVNRDGAREAGHGAGRARASAPPSGLAARRSTARPQPPASAAAVCRSSGAAT